MATRPDQVLTFSVIVTRVVKNGVTLVKGRGVKKGANPHEVDLCGAGDRCYGVVLDDGPIVGDGVKTCQVALPGSTVVPVLVGTGGCTEAQNAKCTADGMADDAAIGGGTVLHELAGRFTQDGVLGDIVGLILNPHSACGT